MLVYNHATKRIEQEIRPPEDAGRAFAMSPDGRFLATGYWNRPKVDVWHLAQAKVISSFGPSQVSRVFYDETGSRLIVQSERGTYIFETTPPFRGVQILGVQDLDDGCVVGRPNQMLVPSRRRCHIAVIDFNACNVAHVSIPIRGTARWIIASPRTSRFVVVDRENNVNCFDATLKKLRWTARIADAASDASITVGSFTGNGRLIGLTLSRDGGYDVAVLNAQTGREIGRLGDAVCDGYPYQGDWVILEEGKILNLRNATILNALT